MMTLRKSLFLALGAALGLAPLASGAAAAARSMLYVANSQGDDITVIDLASVTRRTGRATPAAVGVSSFATLPCGRWVAHRASSTRGTSSVALAGIATSGASA